MSCEIGTEVKTVQVKLYCRCGGEMLPTGSMLTSYPPQYPHKCVKCDEIENIRDKEYPYIEYIEIFKERTNSPYAPRKIIK